MSRTRAHRPYRARLATETSPVESHDHRGGPCDLPPIGEWLRLLRSERHPGTLYDRFRCHWDLPASAYYGSPMCGCAACTGSYDRRLDNRRERRRGRREADEGARIRDEGT